MKKFLVLVLALALAFALAAPAMAFTSDEDTGDDYPYELDIYLVDYDDNDLFGFVTLPETNRGYAKNEIVAAIVELYVPKDEDPYDDDFTTLEITGDNVSYNVTDKAIAGDDAPNLQRMSDRADGWYYDIENNDLEGKDTFQWLVFAKVIDDDASLTAKLVAGSAGGEFDDDDDDVEGDGSGSSNSSSSITVTLNGNTYEVVKSFNEDNGGKYTIKDIKNKDRVIIYVDEHHRSEGMAIYVKDLDKTFDLGVNTRNELGIMDGAKVLTSGHDYDDVMDIYDDVVVDDFGMDYFLIGNYVRDSFFEKLESADTITATVDIKPWSAYVTIPDVPDIIVDPPKTGDAASIMGFVMVALSGAGAVALKKRG